MRVGGLQCSARSVGTSHPRHRPWHCVCTKLAPRFRLPSGAAAAGVPASETLDFVFVASLYLAVVLNLLCGPKCMGRKECLR